MLSPLPSGGRHIHVVGETMIVPGCRVALRGSACAALLRSTMYSRHRKPSLASNMRRPRVLMRLPVSQSRASSRNRPDCAECADMSWTAWPNRAATLNWCRSASSVMTYSCWSGAAAADEESRAARNTSRNVKCRCLLMIMVLNKAGDESGE